ncbi:hypothetical protein GOP47_0021238, partial [Adiantum capillus-veneris]
MEQQHKRNRPTALKKICSPRAKERVVAGNSESTFHLHAEATRLMPVMLGVLHVNMLAFHSASSSSREVLRALGPRQSYDTSDKLESLWGMMPGRNHGKRAARQENERAG